MALSSIILVLIHKFLQTLIGLWWLNGRSDIEHVPAPCNGSITLTTLTRQCIVELAMSCHLSLQRRVIALSQLVHGQRRCASVICHHMSISIHPRYALGGG